MRAADGAGHVDRQHDGQPPHDRHLPQPALRAGQHGAVNHAAAEQHQEIGPEELGETLGRQARRAFIAADLSARFSAALRAALNRPVIAAR